MENIGVGPFDLKAGIDLRRVSKRRSEAEVKGGAFAQQSVERSEAPFTSVLAEATSSPSKV